MPVELSYLIASVGVFFVMILVQALWSDMEHGIKSGVSARDGVVDKSVRVGRAKRANQNMIEGMILFVPLVLAAAYLERFNAQTALGAMLFFWARLAYAPLYWFGVPWLRSGAWFVSIAGILLIFFQILPFSGA